MPLELSEVRDLLDSDRDPVDKSILATAIQVMLSHQVIYEDTRGVPREVIALLRRHRMFFEKYFEAAGFIFRVANREQMIALEVGESVYGWQLNRLRKDETLVRLALRLLLDKGLDSGSIDEAMRVPSDTDEIVDVYRNIAQAEPPAEGRLNDILRDLHRLGAIRVLDRDKAERVTELLLLPGLRVHVPDGFVERVALWVERGRPGEVLEFTGGAREAQAQHDIDELEMAEEADV